MVSTAVETAEPAEVEPWPVLASALVKALRAELLLAFAAVVGRDVAAFVVAEGAVDVAVVADEVYALGSGAAAAVTMVPTAVGAFTFPADALVVAVPGGVAPVVAT